MPMIMAILAKVTTTSSPLPASVDDAGWQPCPRPGARLPPLMSDTASLTGAFHTDSTAVRGVTYAHRVWGSAHMC